MEQEYNANAIETAAQSHWDEQKFFKVTEDLSKEKFFCLCMFPYPSGQLHMGHVRNYTIGDVLARQQRMLGKNVLQPMGWDAFGLPAENAALKHKVAPAAWTKQNIAHMRTQFKRLGFAYDWQREIATCDPEYYRWEQWMFVRLFEKGLVYRKNSVVNWDPVDNTVLANEQVVDGRGWRSGALVERREIPQWFLKITDYADELLADLDKLEEWPDQVKTMQRNWIGRSEGTGIHFNVVDHEHGLDVFTTRPDTLYGCTYLAVAPQHPLALEASQNNPQMQAFIEECSNIKVAEAELATIEKRGMDTGLKAIHPLSGTEVPIWIANFVVMDYGSGAVMSVPAHDQRDFEFAQKYGLTIQQVIQPADDVAWDFNAQAYTDYGILINSARFDGLESADASQKITEALITNSHGERQVNYRLRDWGVSRQRYWGAPIPIIYCEHCGDVPVPEDQLPVLLPEEVNLDKPGSPLADMAEFYQVPCPKCGRPAHRETDTFDTFMESSWYYARYASFNQDKAMLDDRAKYWTPVDQYVGGVEHAVMHLLYARFYHKLLRDEGLLNSDEPFKRLLTQGMVLKDGAKMSKSKGNTVDPQLLIEKYGADTVRLFMMFAAPPEQSLEWSDSGVAGANRFLRRLWHFSQTHAYLNDYNNRLPSNRNSHSDFADISEALRQQRREIHLILKQANYDYQRMQYNTVVSGCMKLLNILEKIPTDNSADAGFTDGQHVIHEGIRFLLSLLAPITPHLTHHLWQHLGYGDDLLNSPWPKPQNDAMKVDALTIMVQINGKVRGKIAVAVDAEQDNVYQQAIQDEKIKSYVDGKDCKKVIYVPGRLINIVVGN